MEEARSWYDLCFLPNIIVDEDMWEDFKDAEKDAEDVCDESDFECIKQGTQWKFIWAFNGSLMVLMGCNFILLALGAFCFWPRLIGSYINCCCGALNCAGAIIALAGVLSPMGVMCGYNKAGNTVKDDDFDDSDSGMTY